MTNPRTLEGGTGVQGHVERPARRPDATADTTSSNVPTRLRRRRAASYRCQPLPDGRRDQRDPVHPDIWTDAELAAEATVVTHLPALVPRCYGDIIVLAGVAQ
jgi:hypothetical protein